MLLLFGRLAGLVTIVAITAILYLVFYLRNNVQRIKKQQNQTHNGGVGLLEINDLVIKTKMASLHEGYKIEDTSGAKLGEVNGNFLQFPAKFAVIDTNGAELIRLEGEKISVRSQFTFYDNSGIELATIKQKLAKVVGEEFWVEKGGAEFIRIYGNFTETDYKIEANGVQVASVHKEWFSWGHQIDISITGKVDHRLVIGAVIVIEHTKNEFWQKALRSRG
jgi:uncharacterized protein YxjI